MLSLFTHLNYLPPGLVSNNPVEHLENLKILFERLQEHDLVINPSKCQFGVSQINFLGHIVNQHGTAPLPEKVEFIRNFKIPETRKSLQDLTEWLTSPTDSFLTLL